MIIGDVLHGVWFGIVLSFCFSFGPAFFSLIQTSIHYGFKTAWPFPIGVNHNDILVVTLLLTVLSGVDMVSFMQRPVVAAVGAAVLMVFAIHTATRKAENACDRGSAVQFEASETPKWYVMYFKGLMVNMFSPVIWLYWIGAIAIASSEHELSAERLYYFFAGVLVTTVLVDLLKCKLASMLQRFLTVRVVNLLNKIVGAIFMGFAVYLLLKAKW